MKAFFALLAVVIVGCGSAGVATGTGGGSGGPQHLVLTAKDFGRVITVTSGSTIEVRLTEEHPLPGSSSTWQATSTDAAVLKLAKESRDPAPRPVGNDTYQADFTAVAAGSAVIQAANPHTCEAMNPAACKAGPGGHITIRVR